MLQKLLSAYSQFLHFSRRSQTMCGPAAVCGPQGAAQYVVHAAVAWAAFGDSLEMQILKPHPRPTESPPAF